MFQLPAFYPILDTGVAGRCGLSTIPAAERLLEAGVRILQFRHKGFFAREVFAEMEQVGRLCRGAGCLFVVNDRADLAVLTGAVLHLGQEDPLPSIARRVTGPDAIIGFSTHNEAQLRAAQPEPADYFALGPVFGTASKENPDPIVGVAELKRLRPLSRAPLVAIGGITRANALQVLAAGADSVAVIGDLFEPGVDPRARAEEWLRLLSTAPARNV